MRILIADDDRSCRLALRKSIEFFGHECIEASDGDQAWKLFEAAKPDVIISDWMMPGMDGLQLCRSVRGYDRSAYTYFILLTMLDDKASMLEGLNAGADDYLTKPLDRSELQARLIVAARVTALHKRIAEQTAQLERAKKTLYEEGRRDPLTRVANRRRMIEDVEMLAARAKRYGQSFCVALFDIDDFKSYNDVCGHAAGDATLRAVAQTIAAHNRASDMVYRYGGEEFLVVLPEQTLEGAMVAIERRRKAVFELGLPHPGRTSVGPVTISAGVALYSPDDNGRYAPVIERADKALYRAKCAGRNRTVADSPRVAA